MKKTLSSPLVAAANNIVSFGLRSNSLSKFQSQYISFGRFLETEKRSLEKLKLPDKKKIKLLASLNIASNFGRPGNLLGSLFSGALDLGGFVGNMFPGRGKFGKPQRPPKLKPPKPTLSGPRLKLGGMRAVGVGNALFAGLDFATGLAEGESVGKAAAGAGGALAGSLLGGAIGQALIPIPGVGFVLGSMAGGFLGGYASDRVYEGGSSLKQKLSEKLKGQEAKQKAFTGGSGSFADSISKFDQAVGKFERGVALGLFGTMGQSESQPMSDTETGDDKINDTNPPESSGGSSGGSSGQLGGKLEDDIMEFRNFRSKEFGASKQRFASSEPQMYQIREMGIYDGGKTDNWKINPLADDTNYEKDAHKGAGHWENRAFDIPVPIRSAEGDKVNNFWKSRGYTTIWRDGGSHDNHVHVEVPKNKAKEFFAGKLKPRDKATPDNKLENSSGGQGIKQGKENVVIGDSIAKGQMDATGKKGKAVVGASPDKVMGYINEMNQNGRIKGNTVELSSGLANNVKDIGNGQKQLESLKSMGAASVLLSGTAKSGNRKDQIQANNELAALAAKYPGFVKFGGGFTPGADNVHPADAAAYNKQLTAMQAIVQPAPQAQVVPAAAPPVPKIQTYPSYNQPQSSVTVMPIMMGSQGGGGQQRPVYIPVGGGGGGGTMIIPGPTEGQVVNSLMKTMLLTNLSAT
jgi:hypothetical protein